MRVYWLVATSVVLTISQTVAYAHLALPTVGAHSQTGHFLGHLLVTAFIALFCLILVEGWRRFRLR